MKNVFKQKRIGRQKRATRTRAKIFGVAKKPRLSIFRSNKHIYGQLIDDEKNRTLVSVSDLDLKTKDEKSEKGKVSSAQAVGKLIAQKAKDLKINEAIFDRGGFKYHGRIKAVAEGAREGGLKV